MASLSKLISIGDKIQVKEISKKRVSSYASQISDIKNDNNIEILLPMLKNNAVYISDGEKLEIVITKQEAVYEFMAEVIATIYDNIPLLKLKAISEPKKIQRRNYYRLKIVKPIKYRIIDTSLNSGTEDDFYKGILLDISEGGIMFCTKKEMEFNDVLEIETDLNNGNIIKVRGTIVRKQYNTEKTFLYEYGVKFQNVARADKDILMKFIFQEQRKLLKKGLI